MINSIRIENLRSIEDSEFVELKPLNVLLGMNSSGKSTFLRSFPLLSQSVNKSLRGPVSWFDVTSVDFGDYQTAKNKYAKENETIRFSFKLNGLRNGIIFRYPNGQYYRYNLTNNSEDVIATISLNDDNKGTFVDRVILSFNSFVINMSIESRTTQVKILIDDVDISMYGVKSKWNFTTMHGILPSFEFTKDGENLLDYRSYLMKLVVNTLAPFCDKRLKNKSRILALFNMVRNSQKESLLYSIKNHSGIVSLEKNTAQWTVDNISFQKVYYLWILSQIPNLLGLIDEEMSAFYTGCSYIAPTRAEASRYYRNQELQITDVDAYGKNLQEFISSLSEKQYISYLEFTKEILGISISVSNTTGHQSLLISNKNGSFNIADVGFGYSQILPIITKLWHITQKKTFYNRNYGKCVVIEQPELHLHPAMQAKVADAFLKTIKLGKDNDIPIILIVETHSQTIINRLGRRVAEDVANQNCINVILFEKDQQEKNSIIRQTSFKENGQIENWPFGFFDPIEL
jgi:Uncharacterized conserved protein